ncbi:hypothetical protein [Thermogutta sp.]|uniref:hypothetical protein n=1 Tax=Thermogutta sp. TaxID=1962930 RepID=UPI0032202479
MDVVSREGRGIAGMSAESGPLVIRERQAASAASLGQCYELRGDPFSVGSHTSLPISYKTARTSVVWSENGNVGKGIAGCPKRTIFLQLPYTIHNNE